jgi:ketosteroid isomerase-like protein
MASLEERLQQVETRLRHLETCESIRALLAQYCRALDARDSETMGSLFCQDATLSVMPWELDFSGHKAVMDFFRQYFQSDWKNPRHHYTNEYIEAEGNCYKSFCYFHETIERGSQSIVGWGTWEDRFALEDGKWKIKCRLVTVLALTPIDKGWARPDKIVKL